MFAIVRPQFRLTVFWKRSSAVWFDVADRREKRRFEPVRGRLPHSANSPTGRGLGAFCDDIVDSGSGRGTDLSQADINAKPTLFQICFKGMGMNSG